MTTILIIQRAHAGVSLPVSRDLWTAAYLAIDNDKGATRACPSGFLKEFRQYR